MAVYEMEVNQYLVFMETDNSNIEIGSVSNTLTMTETITISRKRTSLSQFFNVGQGISVRTSIKNLKINQTLYMWHRATHGQARTVTQFFFPWQKAKSVKSGSVYQTLRITQTITPNYGREVISILTMTQTIKNNIKRIRTLTQTFQMSSNAAAYYSGNHIDAELLSLSPYSLGGPNGSPTYIW